MIRITTIFLCLLLAAAALGRYRAEVSVRETRSEIDKLEISKAEELRKIQVLRAEVAYLENPQRLSVIAEAETELRPPELGQAISAQQFAAAFDDGAGQGEGAPQTPATDVIKHAIAMAQLTDVQ